MAQLQTLIGAYNPENPNKNFIELCCKCIRRCLETSDYDSLDTLLQKIREGVKLVEEDEALIESRINERHELLEKDIIRKQKLRLQSLEEKVKEMIEQQTLSGQNPTLGPNKLKALVSGGDMSEDGRD